MTLLRLGWELHQFLDGGLGHVVVGGRLPNPLSFGRHQSSNCSRSNWTRSNERARQPVWHFYEASGMDKMCGVGAVERTCLKSWTLFHIPAPCIVTLLEHRVATIELLLPPTSLYYYRLTSFASIEWSAWLLHGQYRAYTKHIPYNSDTGDADIWPGSLVKICKTCISLLKLALASSFFQFWMYCVKDSS